MQITKEVRFEAAHALASLPAGHKCANVHGHNYVVGVEMFGEPDEDTGMVVDFGKISKTIRDKYDHALLLHEDHPIAQFWKQLQLPNFTGAAREPLSLIHSWLLHQRLVILPASPTAENLAEAIRKDLSSACGENVVVTRVTVYENESANATSHISEEEANARK